MNYWCLCLSVCERERLWVFLLLERIMSGLAFQQSKTCKTSHKQIYSFNQTAWLDNSPGNNSGQQLTIWSYNLQLITVFLSDSFGGGFLKKKERERIFQRCKCSMTSLSPPVLFISTSHAFRVDRVSIWWLDMVLM